MSKKGKVYLVGAGPGDYKLITLKGKEAIERADVVIYDRLVNKKLLKFASDNAEIIYVGKSPERHTLKQEEINQLLVEKALVGNIVTRLKGGDPFVFGRGGEEAITLKQHEIPYEIVPGITSAISVPAYAGIPVTHRKVTSSVGFITGNEDPTKSDSDIEWDKIATGMGTLVFLMGMGNLPMIVSKLIENGRSPQTPVALIRWGTLPEQETIVGTLETIEKKAVEANFKNPAIIIVGEVVNLRDKIKWFEDKPLFGKSILVTRSRAQASFFVDKIEEMGGEAYEFPTIEIAPPDDYSRLDVAIDNLHEYDWVIFTSVNGVEYFINRLKYKGKDIRALYNSKIAAIGPSTKKELEKYGLIVDYVPAEYRAEAIAKGLKEKGVNGKRVLLPRADIARKVLPKELEKLGAKVDEVVGYKNICATTNFDEVIKLFRDGRIDVITFTSSSTVKNFVKSLKGYDLNKLLQGVKIATIGPITSNAAIQNGLKVDIQADEYTLNGLLEAIINFFNK